MKKLLYNVARIVFIAVRVVNLAWRDFTKGVK